MQLQTAGNFKNNISFFSFLSATGEVAPFEKRGLYLPWWATPGEIELFKRLSTKRRLVSSKKTISPGRWLLKIIKENKKKAFKGPRDLAINLDKYLYGK